MSFCAMEVEQVGQCPADLKSGYSPPRTPVQVEVYCYYFADRLHCTMTVSTVAHLVVA